MELIGDPEALKREILETARREAAALTEAAGDEAAGLLAAAGTKAGEERAAILGAARAEGARRRAMLLASAPAEAARLRAARVETLLEEIKAAALELLAAEAAGTDKAPALAGLAAEAASGIGGSSFIVSSAPDSGLPALSGRIAELAGFAPLELRFEEDAGMGGGVMVRSADGARRWDNTFKGRLERYWPELRREIAAGLGSGRAV